LSASTHVQVPRPASIETMHCRWGDSSIEARSLALGRRKATLTGAAPQSTMFAWFQRSTQLRSIWSAAAVWPQPAASSKPAITRHVAVEALIAELTISAETRETASHGDPRDAVRQERRRQHRLPGQR